MRLLKNLSLVALLALFLTACATVGQPYAEHKVEDIQVGETTRAQIEEMFGSPWRVGLESGKTTWTYGHYRYRVFGDDKTTDLVVRFDSNNRVESYTYNRTLD